MRAMDNRRLRKRRYNLYLSQDCSDRCSATYFPILPSNLKLPIVFRRRPRMYKVCLCASVCNCVHGTIVKVNQFWTWTNSPASSIQCSPTMSMYSLQPIKNIYAKERRHQTGICTLSHSLSNATRTTLRGNSRCLYLLPNQRAPRWYNAIGFSLMCCCVCGVSLAKREWLESFSWFGLAEYLFVAGAQFNRDRTLGLMRFPARTTNTCAHINNKCGVWVLKIVQSSSTSCKIKKKIIVWVFLQYHLN